MFDIMEQEVNCYKYFKQYEIKNRDQLRSNLKTNPIQGVSKSFVETLFANYKKELVQEAKNKSVRLDDSNKLVKIICINDMHIPYHDSHATELCFEFIKEQQPDHLVLNGDIIDCYWLSTFIKNPGNKQFLQHECNTFYKLFSNLRKHIPNTEITYISGNHEDRIMRETWKNPGFFGVDSIGLPSLLKFDKLDIQFEKVGKFINGFLFTHGTRTRKDSSYTAKAEFFDHNCQSGMSGHTHRLGYFAQSSMGSTGFWTENGCLCTLNPEYTKEPPNWQQGFTILNQLNGLTFPHTITYANGWFTYNGVIYK